MNKSHQKSRRNFIKLATASTMVMGSSPSILGSPKTYFLEAEEMPQQVSANDRIRLALIGAGQMGFGDVETALRVPGVELVAAADVYDGRLARVKEVFGTHIFTTRDYRELLVRSDVDAIIIATPDHWHSQMAIDAMKAGKDVYCEKPMVQTLAEGHPVIEAQKQTKRILQVGSQFVSSIVYKKAQELLASGVIGELNMVESSLYRRSPIGAWQYSIPPDASPETIDWDRFLGRAPKVPFDPIRLFRWRNYRDYGTGIGGDLFVHQFSSLHFITGAKGPSRVVASGGLHFWKDGRDVPDLLLGLFDYPKTSQHPAFNVVFRVNFADGEIDQYGGDTWVYRFVGSEGVIQIDNGVTLKRRPPLKEPGYTIDTFPKAIQEQFLKEYRAKYPLREPETRTLADERYLPPNNYRERLDHFKNFFRAMRTREQVLEDAVFGFRAAAPALLANLSYFENRIYEWDPETMQANGANRC